MLCAMVAGTPLVILLGARSEPVREEPAPPPIHHERPWLAPEAAAEIIADGGAPGPLFDGIELGGPAPPPEVRARIAAFARAHDVDLELEIADDELVAVRFAVTFGGCCGYEGADVLALRLERPRTGTCCESDGDWTGWLDDWSVARDDTVMHVRVRVNRVAVRWERRAKATELLDRVDAVIGVTIASARAAAGDRWTDIEPGRRFLLELPYAFGDARGTVSLRDRDDLGAQLVAAAGRITEASFSVRSDGALDELRAALTARWGRPRVTDETDWSWRTPDRTITAALYDDRAQITIARR